MPSYDIFNERTTTFFYNLKAKPIQRMLDFDYLSGRLPSISAIIHSGKMGFHKIFFGEKEILIPIYDSITQAVKKHPLTESFITFASFRSAYKSAKDALEIEQINVITIVAEGIPERQTKELIALAKEKGKTIIGPATVGAMVAGKFRVGHAGGSNENILRCKLYRPGSVGLVSRSGGMMNELFNIISRSTDGIYEGVAIGGDQFPGSTLIEHMFRYEQNPNIKMIVALGEIGGSDEYEIIEAKKQGKLSKPIVMWVAGTCASLFPFEVQFGHAGAKSGKENESAQNKNQELRKIGIVVPEGFEDFEMTIAQVFKNTQANFIPEMQEPKIPERKKTHFTSTITDERGVEPIYGGVPLSKVVNLGIGSTIGLLWFKKKLPDYFNKFLELAIILTADHGPAVSGAHNAIVASRAGKDIISSLASGLLTIGPKFGGAIDDASRYFKDALEKQMTPSDFVSNIKNSGKLIPGIGHRVKSKSNPDKRVEILIKFARKNFPKTNYLNYALEVEKVTLEKSENLILNVDGCLAALFLDALEESFQEEEINQIIEIGYMNGLFALARSIGIIGHVLDQKRLKEPLYRHPVDDIMYNV